MDKASDFGSEDCRFESCHGRPELSATSGMDFTFFEAQFVLASLLTFYGSFSLCYHSFDVAQILLRRMGG